MTNGTRGDARESIRILKRFGLSYKKMARLAGWHPCRVTRVVKREEPASQELSAALREVLERQLLSKTRLVLRLLADRKPDVMTCCDTHAVINEVTRERLMVAVFRAILASLMRGSVPRVRLPKEFKAVTVSWRTGGGVLDVAYTPPLQEADQLRARAHEHEHMAAVLRAKAETVDPRPRSDGHSEGF
jgi:hypothetical protein